MNNYRELIQKHIGLQPGLNNIQLSLKIMDEISPVRFEYQDFVDTLARLIVDKEIIKLEYYSTDLSNGSIYFPKGTNFHFNVDK